jgi:hypothetical protein
MDIVNGLRIGKALGIQQANGKIGSIRIYHVSNE